MTDLNVQRQEELLRGEGWNQKALRKLNIAILGESILTNYLLVYFSCLFGKTEGEIKLIGNSRIEEGNLKGEFLINGLTDKYPVGGSKVECLADAIKGVNPKFHVTYYHTCYDSNVLDGSDIIIDLTNDPIIKQEGFEYSVKKNKSWITASSDRSMGALIVKKKNKLIKPIYFKKFVQKNQGIIPSGLIAGIISDEVRKHAFQFNNMDQTLEGLLCYNLNSGSRFSSRDTIKEEGRSLKNKKVLVVGGGGIGNYVSLGLTLMGIGVIDIVDFDTVQETDLNRQFLFYNSEKEKKVDVLAKRLKRLTGCYSDIKINPIFGEINDKLKKGRKVIDKNYLSEKKYDLILSCVDNERARYILNDNCLDLGIPLINGGVNFNEGNVYVSVPKKTACLGELSGVRYEQEVRNSCRNQMPSVVYTNAIIASTMLGEVRNVMFPRLYGEPIKNQILYSSFQKEADERMLLQNGIIKPQKNCKCYKLLSEEVSK